MMMEHIWIDCDPGIDDSVMLALAAAHRDVLCIHGISTVAGNQGSDLVTDNALRVARTAARKFHRFDTVALGFDPNGAGAGAACFVRDGCHVFSFPFESEAYKSRFRLFRAVRKEGYNSILYSIAQKFQKLNPFRLIPPSLREIFAVGEDGVFFGKCLAVKSRHVQKPAERYDMMRKGMKRERLPLRVHFEKEEKTV